MELEGGHTTFLQALSLSPHPAWKAPVQESQDWSTSMGEGLEASPNQSDRVIPGQQDHCLSHSLEHLQHLKHCLHATLLLLSHSVMSDSATPWSAAHQASLSFTISWSLLKLMSIESMMPSNHLILCCPLLLLPSVFHSIRVFSNESALCIKWPKYWSFNFGISPSNEYSGPISLRMDWFALD